MNGLRRVSGPVGLLGLFFLGAGGLYLGVFREFNILARALLSIGIVLVAYYLWFNTETVGRAAKGRSIRAGSSATLTTFFFIGIVALICFMSVRYAQRWDLTEAKTFTLAPQTVAILHRLPSTVNVYGFFSFDDGRKQRAEDLLKEYTAVGDKLNVQFLDVNERPELIDRYQLRQSGTIVFDSGQKYEKATSFEETEFTSALIRLSQPQRKVYFLTGHGEHPLDGQELDGYAAIKRILELDNYQIEALNLLTAQKVPDDASVLVAARPLQPLQSPELRAIKEYLEAGGHALMLADPRSGGALNSLVEPWGVQVLPGQVVDPQSSIRNIPTTVVTASYADSPITRDMQRVLTLYPSAAAVTPISGTPPGLLIKILVATTPQSWVETDRQSANFDEGVDVRGPVSLMVTVEQQVQPGTEGTTKATRLVVIGDSDFASNAAAIEFAGNRDLFVNSVNWLAQAEELISLRPKLPDDRAMLIQPAQANLVTFSSAFLLPLLALAGGALVWYSRR
ncbi:MAG: GldG family protein [Chloroflexi bacterium]|nr:GldG family protein [Chloroflexota bacterium]